MSRAKKKDKQNNKAAIIFERSVNNGGYPKVDEWIPVTEEDKIFDVIKGFFIAPLNKSFNLNLPEDSDFDYFFLPTKKCYNSTNMRSHLYQYLNYFEKFYDTDREYISILYYLKLIIDQYDENAYPQQAFFYDLERYILRSSLETKVCKMTDDNYQLNLKYVNKKTPILQYTNDHAKILLRISILMNLCIPLLTQYAYKHSVDSIDDYLLEFFDKIMYLYPVNIYAKLYETTYTNTNSNQNTNKIIWKKQNIRSIDIDTHSMNSVVNMILNIIPRYLFDVSKNIISFNTSAIRNNTKYTITDIGFEFEYIQISSSKRDDDSVSEFDRFESSLIKQNEALYLQNKVNCEETMKFIEMQYGPFDDEEIKLYTDILLKDANGNCIIQEFQKRSIFDMFYKYFKDVESIKAINRDQYIKLVLSAKRILENSNMVLLANILTGNITKYVSRKTVNKRILQYIESSPSYNMVIEKYRSDTIKKHIVSIIGTILASEFNIIDKDPKICGYTIDIISVIPELVEQVLIYILLC